MSQSIILPEGFVWGAGISAYQGERTGTGGGNVESIWDRFAEDILLAAQLNLNSYRFSISWPRVQPGGQGEYNQVALDFYDRVIDCLLAKDIQPFVTLYRCDLPRKPGDGGGWTGGETGQLFAEYGAKMIHRYGDRVKYWTTFDEAWRSTYLDHQAAHHLLVAHGLASQAMRAAAKSPVLVGIALNLSPSEPLRAADLLDIHLAEAAWRKDCGRYLDPLILGKYQAAYAENIDGFREGDLEIIRQKLDFVGINFYSRNVVSRLPKVHPIEGSEYTAMDWEVHAPSLRNLLNRISREYDKPVLYVTGNGGAFDDKIGADGQILDERRDHYIRRHIEQCALALKDGVDLRGYFAWSLLDDLELVEGYARRCGLVHVDYKTKKRTTKQSGHTLARVARGGSL